MRKQLAVLAAMKRETSGIRGGRLRLHRRAAPVGPHWVGEVGRAPILLAHCGLGSQSAAASARAFLEAYPVGALISVGFAAALEASMESGTLILADEVHGEAVFPCDRSLLLHAEALLREMALPFRRGRLITVERLAGSPEEKRRLARETGGLAADMESAGAAAAARRSSIPFLAVRAISDRLDQPVDPWLAGLIRPDGGVRFGRLALGILSHPGRLFLLQSLRRQTHTASANLNRFLLRFLAALDPLKEG